MTRKIGFTAYSIPSHAMSDFREGLAIQNDLIFMI